MSFPATNWCKLPFSNVLGGTSGIDLNSDTFKCALYTNSITGTYNFDTTNTYNSAPWDNNEVSGSGYVSGGGSCASPTLTISSGKIVFDANDVSWSSATFTARGCLLYDDTISPKSGIVAVNFGSDFTATAGTFTIQWNPSGIFTIT